MIRTLGSGKRHIKNSIKSICGRNTIKRFFNTAKDTNEAVVTQRVSVKYIRANAVSEITTL